MRTRYDAVKAGDKTDLLGVGNLVVVTDGTDRAGRETDDNVQATIELSNHHRFMLAMVDGTSAEELQLLEPTGFYQLT